MASSAKKGKGLTRETILAESIELIRRFGPDKFTVTDVARHFGMSHSNVYRFYETKAAIFEAVSEAWLAETFKALERASHDGDDGPSRIKAVMTTLHARLRSKAAKDPEIFRTYAAVAETDGEAQLRHVAALRGLLAGLLAEAAGTTDPTPVVEALDHATWRFRDPRAVLRHLEEDSEPALERVLDLMLAGLEPPAPAPKPAPPQEPARPEVEEPEDLPLQPGLF